MGIKKYHKHKSQSWGVGLHSEEPASLGWGTCPCHARRIQGMLRHHLVSCMVRHCHTALHRLMSPPPARGQPCVWAEPQELGHSWVEGCCCHQLGQRWKGEAPGWLQGSQRLLALCSSGNARLSFPGAAEASPLQCSFCSRENGVGAGGAELGAHPRGVLGADGVWRGPAGLRLQLGVPRCKFPALCLLQAGCKQQFGVTAKPPTSCGSGGVRRQPELRSAQPGTPLSPCPSKTEQGCPSSTQHGSQPPPNTFAPFAKQNTAKESA